MHIDNLETPWVSARFVFACARMMALAANTAQAAGMTWWKRWGLTWTWDWALLKTNWKGGSTLLFSMVQHGFSQYPTTVILGMCWSNKVKWLYWLVDSGSQDMTKYLPIGSPCHQTTLQVRFILCQKPDNLHIYNIYIYYIIFGYCRFPVIIIYPPTYQYRNSITYNL